MTTLRLVEKLIKDKAMLNAGINFIKNDLGVELPVFYSPGKKKSQVLWVLFSAGGPRRKLRSFYPLFDRISWVTNYFQSPCLIFEDPSYYYNTEIQDGWYLGTYTKSYHEMIVDCLKNILVELGLPNEALRFFGSSTGGTAAMWVSEQFAGSICIASNPQIDISIWPTYSSTCQILQDNHLQWPTNVQSVVQNKNSRLFISFNLVDAYDKEQVSVLCSYLNTENQVVNMNKEGVYSVDNKFIWFYNIQTQVNNPHNVLPLFGMLMPIESLFFHKMPPEAIQMNFAAYRDLMRDYYQVYDALLSKNSANVKK